MCNKIKLGYEWFWHLQVQTVPSSKGEKHLSPHLPSQTEDTLASLSRGWVLKRGPGAGPSVKFQLGEAGVQLRKKDFPKWRGGKGRGQLRDTLLHSKQQFSGVWSVEPLMSLRPFHEIPEVESYFQHHSDISWLQLCWHLLWCITAVTETMVANCTSNYFHQNFLFIKT